MERSSTCSFPCLPAYQLRRRIICLRFAPTNTALTLLIFGAQMYEQNRFRISMPKEFHR